jgi:hypothetical protein
MFSVIRPPPFSIRLSNGIAQGTGRSVSMASAAAFASAVVKTTKLVTPAFLGLPQ